MVSEQLHYTTNREEIFIFSNKKMSYLCGVWRFANAYILILEKESTHSKVDAPRWFLNVLTDTAYPVCRQDRHFYFRLFLLLRKASNAITRLPKAHNNVNMPMKIERISKAVIHVNSSALIFPYFFPVCLLFFY